MASADAGGGGFFDLASHCVDVLHWLTGRPIHPCTVQMHGRHHGTARLQAGRSIDCRMESGWEADDLRIRVTVESPRGILTATSGTLSLDGRTLLDDGPPAASAAVDAWLDAVFHDGTEGLVSVEDGVRVARAIDTLRGMSTKHDPRVPGCDHP